MQDTFYTLLQSWGFVLVSGLRTLELLVALLVAVGFLSMAVLGREEGAEAADVEHDEAHGWQGQFIHHHR